MFKLMHLDQYLVGPMAGGRGEQVKLINTSLGTEKIHVHLNRLAPRVDTRHPQQSDHDAMTSGANLRTQCVKIMHDDRGWSDRDYSVVLQPA